MLSTIPLVFVWSESYKDASRRDFPRVFRGISLYAGIVLCLLHLFCSKNLTGVKVDEVIGSQLQHYGKSYPITKEIHTERNCTSRAEGAAFDPINIITGRTFIILNWVLQLLCAAQTDVLHKQQLNFAKHLESYPYFLHAVKQVSNMIPVQVMKLNGTDHRLYLFPFFMTGSAFCCVDSHFCIHLGIHKFLW